MAVEIRLTNGDRENPEFVATDLETNEEVGCKNWYEKSKSKYHIVLAQNSANRKYIAHNEFFAKVDDNGVYLVEDKTTGPRKLGTANPDKILVPFMSPEDKARYDEIIAAATENRLAQKAKPMTDEEKLEAKIKRLEAKLAKTRSENTEEAE